MPMSDLNDRAEGWGHTAGDGDLLDDDDWETMAEDPDFNDDTTNERLGNSVDTTDADSREYGGPEQSGDLFDRTEGYGQSNGDPGDDVSIDFDSNSSALNYTGSNTPLDDSSTEADATNRNAEEPSEEDRQKASIQDRTDGYGHTATTNPNGSADGATISVTAALRD